MARVWIGGTNVRLGDAALAAALTRAEVQERLTAVELARRVAVARARALQARVCGSKGRPGETCADPDVCGCGDANVKPLDGDCYDDTAALDVDADAC